MLAIGETLLVPGLDSLNWNCRRIYAAKEKTKHRTPDQSLARLAIYIALCISSLSDRDGDRRSTIDDDDDDDDDGNDISQEGPSMQLPQHIDQTTQAPVCNSAAQPRTGLPRLLHSCMAPPCNACFLLPSAPGKAKNDSEQERSNKQAYLA